MKVLGIFLEETPGTSGHIYFDGDFFTQRVSERRNPIRTQSCYKSGSACGRTGSDNATPLATNDSKCLLQEMKSTRNII